MKRGPKPQPLVVQELHGNPSKLPTPSMTPEGVGDLWAPPAWFDDDQRAQWDRALENAPTGLLTGTDHDVLVMYCVAVVEHMRAVIELRRTGQLITTDKGNTIQSPALGIVNRQALLAMRAAGELGFTPAARTSLGRAHDATLVPSGRYIGGARAKAGSLDQYLADKPDKLAH